MFTKRISIRMLVASVMVGLMVTAAFAALTFHSGPEFVQVDADTFQLTAEASGMGNTRMLATIVVSADVDYTCRNKGGNEVEAQSPAHLSTTGTEDIRADHNGRGEVDLTVSLEIPATVPGKEVGCPNGNWVGVNPTNIQGVTAVATITFGGATVYTASLP